MNILKREIKLFEISQKSLYKLISGFYPNHNPIDAPHQLSQLTQYPIIKTPLYLNVWPKVVASATDAKRIEDESSVFGQSAMPDDVDLADSHL